jgi:hypothetical protein
LFSCAARVSFPRAKFIVRHGIPKDAMLLKQLTADADELLVQKLNEAINNFTVIQCGVMFTEKEFYSKNRDFRTHFYLVFAKDRGGALGAEGGTGPDQMEEDEDIEMHSNSASIFSKSILVRRRGIPNLLSALPRRVFRDWAKGFHRLCTAVWKRT